MESFSSLEIDFIFDCEDCDGGIAGIESLGLYEKRENLLISVLELSSYMDSSIFEHPNN